VLAQLALRVGDRATAKEKLLALVAAGGDGYDARMQLAQLAIEDKDWKTAEKELARAKTLDPERSEPYAILAELYFKNNREDEALVELEGYARIEQMEYGPVKKLVDKYAARGAWAKVVELGEIGVMINPYDPDLHLALGDAYLALKKYDDAVWAFDSALLCDPPPHRPAVAWIGLARGHLAKKDGKKARHAVEQALKLEPRNADALELRRKVK
jgi:Tfp pilus assembly protein PilF